MGRGKEAGYIADWAESDFGLPRENDKVPPQILQVK
jgi:hypothetical protein